MVSPEELQDLLEDYHATRLRVVRGFDAATETLKDYSALTLGQVVRPVADVTDPIALAQADSIANGAGAYGLVHTSGLKFCTLCVDGFLQVPDHGLTPGAPFYLSQVTAGELTSTKPASGLVVELGVALDEETLIVRIGGGGGVAGGGGGTGDMEKSVYDSNDDGVVDAADTAAALSGGSAGQYYDGADGWKALPASGGGGLPSGGSGGVYVDGSVTDGNEVYIDGSVAA